MRCLAWTALGCAALLLALGLGCGLYSRQIAHPYHLTLSDIASSVDQEQWTQAAHTARGAELEWKKQSSLLFLFANHEDVNAVASGWAQLKIALQEKQRYESLLILQQLSDALTMIHDRDAFALKNVL